MPNNERYASISKPLISEVINGYSKFSNFDDAKLFLERISNTFTISKKFADLEKESEIIIWLFEFEITEEEKIKGYLGNYAKLFIVESNEFHNIHIEKYELDLKYHPRGLRAKRSMPNFGHPLIRRIIGKRRLYKETISDAESELDLLKAEYPTNSIRGSKDKLYIHIYDRGSDSKNPVGKYVIKIAIDEDNKPYLFLDKNFHQPPPEKAITSSYQIGTHNAQQASEVFFGSSSPDENQAILASSALSVFRDFDLRRLQKLKEEDGDDTIYHFTSINVLESILSNGNLWFTDLQRMNDISEIEHGWSVVNNVINDIIDDSSLKLKNTAKLIEPKLDGPDRVRSRMFGLCFCEKEELFSQWTSYGDSGQGVAIGFKPQSLLSSNRVLLSKVHYNLQKKKEVVWRMMETLESIPVDISSNTENIAKIFRFMAAFLKHNGFYMEREWRAVFIDNNDYPISYRDREDLHSIPYISAPSKDICFGGIKSLISKIIVGPSANLSITQGVESVLSRYGFDHIEVKKSELPMR